MKNKTWYISIPLVLCSIYLRFYLLPQKLFFGPEQGVDFDVIRQMVYSHHLTLIGPKTDIRGIFHGLLYYYISVIPFYISKGNPLFSIGFLIVLQSLTVFVLYQLGKELVNKKVGIIASLLFTFSFGAIAASRWLSTQPLSILFSSFFLLFYLQFLKGSKKSIFFAIIAAGLLGQVEFINFLYLLVFLCFSLVFYYKRFGVLSLKEKVFAIILLGLSTSGTYILFDIRHQFLITKSITNLLIGKSRFHVSYVTSLLQVFKQFFNLYSDSLMPLSFELSILLFALSLTVVIRKYWKKNIGVQIIVLWTFVPLILLILLRYTALYQLFLALIPSIILITSICLAFMIEKARILAYICIVTIIVCNIVAWNLFIPYNKHIFFQTTQPDLAYSDEARVINWIYKQANGQPFTYQAYTIPYWSSQGWDYLFWYYGKNKYTYVPLKNNDKNADRNFIIVQDDLSNIRYQENWINSLLTGSHNIINKKRFGILVVDEIISKK